MSSETNVDFDDDEKSPMLILSSFVKARNKHGKRNHHDKEITVRSGVDRPKEILKQFTDAVKEAMTAVTLDDSDNNFKPKVNMRKNLSKKTQKKGHITFGGDGQCTFSEETTNNGVPEDTTDNGEPQRLTFDAETMVRE